MGCQGPQPGWDSLSVLSIPRQAESQAHVGADPESWAEMGIQGVCMYVNVPSEHSRRCCHKALASRSPWVLQEKGRGRTLAFHEHRLCEVLPLHELP